MIDKFIQNSDAENVFDFTFEYTCITATCLGYIASKCYLLSTFIVEMVNNVWKYLWPISIL